MMRVMDTIVYTAAASLIAAAVLVMLLFTVYRQVATLDAKLPVTAEWLQELSVERYLPMLHLLDDSDIRHLRTQPGFRPEIERTLRAQRCRAFRGYLRTLDTDFIRICAAIKFLMARSHVDRPELARLLLGAQVSFAVRMLAIEVKLWLYCWDLCTVDAHAQVSTFGIMRRILGLLVPSESEALSWQKPCRVIQ